MRHFVIYFHRGAGYDPKMGWGWRIVQATDSKEAWELARELFGARAYNVVLWADNSRGR